MGAYQRVVHLRPTYYKKTLTGLTRLHGCRRYDYMEVIGRVEPGAETERM